jgi:predicted metalloprotease
MVDSVAKSGNIFGFRRVSTAMQIMVVAGLITSCGTSTGVSISRSDARSSDVPSTDVPSTDVPSTDVPSTDVPSTDVPTMMHLPGTDIPLVGPYPYDADKPPQPFDGLMVATVEDLQQFWADTMPQVFGIDYVPLAGGVMPAYPERTNYPADGCFSSYAEIEGNGFYCPSNDSISWDDVGYARDGFEDHGSGAITGLMSHEWGHAIQERTGVFDVVPEVPTPVVELQADCYSGAWFAHVARGESSLLSFADADIRSGLLDTALSADPVGVTPTDEGAHGAGFDRVGAFQDGFNNGAVQCATYVEHNPPITEFGFDDSYANDPDPGDLPYADLLTAIPQDLNVFWDATLSTPFPALTVVPFTGQPPACDGLDPSAILQTLAIYCAADHTVLLNDVAARQAVDRIGDFSAGYFLAQAWAEAAQTSVGSGRAGVKRVLYDDCFVGVWAKSLPMAENEERVAISPGDLDEAVATAILFADDSADIGVNGDAYGKIDAFRQGVLGGIQGCNDHFS